MNIEGKLAKDRISSRNRSISDLNQSSERCGDGEDFGELGEDPVAGFGGERLADAAGDDPGGVDALAGRGAR